MDRLVEPIIAGGGGAMPPSRDDDSGGSDGGGSARRQPVEYERQASGYHPFVQGLLDTLPEPETNWTIEGRAKWLQAAANIFDLIYKGSGEIHITAKSAPSKDQ